MDRYWKNASGYYDPTLAKVIEKENSIEKTDKKARKKAGPRYNQGDKKHSKRQRPRIYRTDRIKRHKDQ